MCASKHVIFGQRVLSGLRETFNTCEETTGSGRGRVVNRNRHQKALYKMFLTVLSEG